MSYLSFNENPLNHENLTPQEIEQNAAELAYFLRIPISFYVLMAETSYASICGHMYVKSRSKNI